MIRSAVGQCQKVSGNNGVIVVRYTQKGHVKVVEYRFWWLVKVYETRDGVCTRVALGLTHADMTGIEVTIG